MKEEPEFFLDALLSGQPTSCSVAVLTAHPDDEVIGLGSRLPWLRMARFIRVTDGAPAGTGARLSRNEPYARARRRELQAAFSMAGIPWSHAEGLGFVDQRVSFHLRELIAALTRRLRLLQPVVVLTHPYEGGHPDHDATALAVHASCRWLTRHGMAAPVIYEMTSYHAGGNGTMQAGEFLPYPSLHEVRTLHLMPGEQRFKWQLLDCFTTQRDMLARFPLQWERFRRAPDYDFEQPPHPGPLFYEQFDWGIHGARWRAEAGQALAELDLRHAEA